MLELPQRGVVDALSRPPVLVLDRLELGHLLPGLGQGHLAEPGVPQRLLRGGPLGGIPGEQAGEEVEPGGAEGRVRRDADAGGREELLSEAALLVALGPRQVLRGFAAGGWCGDMVLWYRGGKMA